MTQKLGLGILREGPETPRKSGQLTGVSARDAINIASRKSCIVKNKDFHLTISACLFALLLWSEHDTKINPPTMNDTRKS